LLRHYYVGLMLMWEKMMKLRMLAVLIQLVLLCSSVRADDLRTAMEASNKQWLEAFNTPNIACILRMPF
jgi:hypothetical protein